MPGQNLADDLRHAIQSLGPQFFSLKYWLIGLDDFYSMSYNAVFLELFVRNHFVAHP